MYLYGIMVFKISCFFPIIDLKKSQIRKFGTVRNTRYMLSNHFSTKLPERFSDFNTQTSRAYIKKSFED